MKGDGLGRLKAVAGNADAIFAWMDGAEIPEGDLDIRRDPRTEDRHAVVQMAIDAAGRLDGPFVLDAEVFLDRRRSRPAGDGGVQDRVGRLQVLLHQEGGNVQCLGEIVEARSMPWPACRSPHRATPRRRTRDAIPAKAPGFRAPATFGSGAPSSDSTRSFPKSA